jgi:hypothetical protein
LRFCGFASQKYSTTRNLQTAAELSVTKGKKFKSFRFGNIEKAKAVFFEE